MFDSKSYNPEEFTLDAIWVGAVEGILSGGSSYMNVGLGIAR